MATGLYNQINTLSKFSTNDKLTSHALQQHDFEAPTSNVTF